MIYAAAGISLSPAKRALVCSRLTKRLRELEIPSFAEYYAYLISVGERDPEYQAMINCITTNKTEFFRESHHFEFLKNEAFPRIKQRAQQTGTRRLRIWSAGCSTGEEPYTIAMTILAHFGPLSNWDVGILASDIDTDVLRQAQEGIYPVDRLGGISEEFQRRYLLRGTGECGGLYRVRPEVRNLISFKRLNLMEEPWPVKSQFDLIFCRNVLIYFDRETQRRIVQRFAEKLADDGHLFLGHSENVDWLGCYLTSQGNTIHRRKAGSGPRTASPTSMTGRARVPMTGPASAPAPRQCEVVPGSSLLSGSAAELVTEIEAGIVVCLSVPGSRAGGLAHLPFGAADETVAGCEDVLQRLAATGVNLGDVQAKLVIANPQGSENLEALRAALNISGVSVTGEKTVTGPRLAVRFFTETGRALVGQIEPAVAE
jgi:chemotaxis protein methyltransferase CheR